MNIKLQTNQANPTLEFRSIHTAGIDSVRMEIWLKSGCFMIEHHRVYFEVDSIMEFTSQLKSMSETLHGKAVLKPLHEPFLIAMELDRRGHVTVSGEIRDIYPAQKLLFEFETDQTCLESLQLAFQKLCDLLAPSTPQVV